MNLDQLKRNVGFQIRTEPTPCWLDEHGILLSNIDDDWIIKDVLSETVELSNTRTGHVIILGKDHIHHFTSNPHRGPNYGFLTLHVQIFVRGNECSIRPNFKPGEAVKPPAVEIFEKDVSIDYPEKTGIIQKLKNEGYRSFWCADCNLAEMLDVKGWERVIERDRNGTLCSFRVKDRVSDLFLLKKR